MKKFLVLLSTYCLLSVCVQPLIVNAELTESTDSSQNSFDSDATLHSNEADSTNQASKEPEVVEEHKDTTTNVEAAEEQTEDRTEETSDEQQTPVMQPAESEEKTADAVGDYLIPDVELRKIVNKELGKSDAELATYSATEAELASIKSLSLTSLLGAGTDLVQFSTLQGIEYLTGLTGSGMVSGLTIHGAILPEDALMYLSKMTNLERLAFRNSYFTGNEATVRDMDKSINGENFESVKFIPIQQNIDFSPLSALTNLVVFEFDTNSVDMYPNSLGSSRLYLKLSGLKALTKLTSLDISNVGEFDDPTFSWITSLTNLKKVSIVDSHLTSVNAISELPHLTQLNIGGTYVNDLTPVIDKNYFIGATDLHYNFETQFYTEENGVKILQLPTVYNFGGTDISTVSYSTLSSFVGTFNINDSFFEPAGLNISLIIKDVKPINKYNYVTGQYDIATAGIVFGLTATAPNGKVISYSTNNSVPIGKVVTFDSDYENGPIETVKLEPLETAVTPIEVTRDGYVFEGWYTDKEHTQAFDFTTEITENITLYAKWAKINTSDVIVKYVDEKGKALAAPETLSGPVGSPYETTAKTITGWELTAMPTNAKGVFTEEAQEVIYVYSEVKTEIPPVEPTVPPTDNSEPPVHESDPSSDGEKVKKELPATGENRTITSLLTISGVILLMGVGVYFTLENRRAKK